MCGLTAEESITCLAPRKRSSTGLALESRRLALSIYPHQPQSSRPGHLQDHVLTSDPEDWKGGGERK